MARPARRREARKTSSKKSDPVDWDAKVEAHIRSKSREELADLAWTLVRRFAEAFAEIRERLALQDGDVGRLVDEARKAIKKATAEPGWSNRWSGEGYRPDYGPVRKRLERLLELGHADEVVALGREFLRRGLEQVASSHDEEGETAMDFAEALSVVFEAAMQSSLTGPERLLLAIDAELGDDIDALGDATAIVLDADYRARGLVGRRRRLDGPAGGGAAATTATGIVSPGTTRATASPPGSPVP